MVSVNNISRNYGSKKVLENISFTLANNGVYGFLGPNGAGKSTLLRIISGFKYPDEGTVRTGSVIGYLPENSPLDRNLSVYEFLFLFASMKGLKGMEKTAEIQRVVDLCSIQDVACFRMDTLSRGYRQRTGLAQALLNHPGILLLDEPLSGLDPEQVVSVRKIIKNAAEESIVLISSHNLKELEQISSRIFIMNKGRIEAQTEISDDFNLEEFYLKTIGSFLQ